MIQFLQDKKKDRYFCQNREHYSPLVRQNSKSTNLYQDKLHSFLFLRFFRLLTFLRPARTAISNVRLTFHCDNAEHSIYWIASMSRHIWSPRCGDIGVRFFALNETVEHWLKTSNEIDRNLHKAFPEWPGLHGGPTWYPPIELECYCKNAWFQVTILCERFQKTAGWWLKSILWIRQFADRTEACIYQRQFIKKTENLKNSLQ